MEQDKQCTKTLRTFTNGDKLGFEGSKNQSPDQGHPGWEAQKSAQSPGLRL